MTESKQPEFNFQRHPSTLPLEVPSKVYFQNHPGATFKYLATGAFLFDTRDPVTPRLLLIQRCAHDSWPNCWEIPGGACDDEDESILHGLARELWEETGLAAAHIGPILGDIQQFITSSGKQIGKFLFFVKVEGEEGSKEWDVRLDPNEHQDFLWASEDEVQAKRKGELELIFTTSDAYDTILSSFEVQRAGEMKKL